MKLWTSVAAIALALPWAGSVAAKEKEPPALRWAHTWAEAVEQARDRNAVIFATFHKDH